MFNITIEAEAADELAAKVKGLAVQMGLVPVGYLSTFTQADNAPTPTPQPPQAASPAPAGPVACEEPAPKKRGPKPKAEKEAEAAPAGNDSTPAQPAAPVSPPLTQTTHTSTPAATKEEAITALQSVNSNINMNAAREVLTEFKVSRAGELKPEQYGPFIAACNKKIAQTNSLI